MTGRAGWTGSRFDILKRSRTSSLGDDDNNDDADGDLEEEGIESTINHRWEKRRRDHITTLREDDADFEVDLNSNIHYVDK